MSWLDIAPESQFSLANIPFGIISNDADPNPRPAIAIGEYALDLAAFASGGGFDQLPDFPHLAVFKEPTLNSFAELGRTVHRSVREYLQQVFARDTPFSEVLKMNVRLKQAALIPLPNVKMHLPLKIGDYTDFYAGKNHAYNVGALFRGPDNALQPNYCHLPVGYHGRASSVVVSGTPIRRPWGQFLPTPSTDKIPVFRPSLKLDMELEFGVFVCGGNALGHPISVDEADNHIFGYVLVNDWSARDVQAWEYVPLGPFNSKNLGTTISPWVVLADALELCRTAPLPNDNTLLPYLQTKTKDIALDINLEVTLQTVQGNESIIAKTSTKNLLWSWPQMIAHHTVTGCNLRTGDLLASGTISGTGDGTQGSLLEQTMGGKVELQLPGNETRKFLEDGDTIIIKGYAGTTEHGLIGFGDCLGQIQPAHP